MTRDPAATGERHDPGTAETADQLEYRLHVEKNVDRIVSWLTDETLAKLAVLLRPDRP